MTRLALVCALALLAGCVSVSEGVGSLSEVGADSVLLVGKIQIVPPIRPEEQRYRAGLDPFDTKRYFVGRAILFVSDRPQYQERTGEALNPPLEQIFFLKLSKAQRFMVKGSVTMELTSRGASAGSGFDQTELMFPGPIQFDIRPGDKIVYVGTLRLHRDEFHEVTKAEVRDEYGEAAAALRTKFGDAAVPRKALIKPTK